MTAFFLPGLSNDTRVVEDAYRDMRRRVEIDMGRPPSRRRISRLWTRRGSQDCITEVGSPDPLLGGTVVAIFDMGSHQPFVVWRQPDAAARPAVCDILGCNAYSVSVFD